MPSTNIAPSVGANSPVNNRPSVDLPDATRPMMPIRSPGRMVRLRSLNAGRLAPG